MDCVSTLYPWIEISLQVYSERRLKCKYYQYHMTPTILENEGLRLLHTRRASPFFTKHSCYLIPENVVCYNHWISCSAPIGSATSWLWCTPDFLYCDMRLFGVRNLFICSVRTFLLMFLGAAETTCSAETWHVACKNDSIKPEHF